MEKVMALLETLAQKIGQTVEILWPHAVRYEALSAGVMIVIWTCMASILWLSYWKFSDQPWTFPCASGKPDDNYPSAKLLLIILAPVITFIAAMIWILQFPIVLEPTGYVVMKILGK